MKKILISVGSFFNDYILDNQPFIIGQTLHAATKKSQDSRIICDLSRVFDVTVVKPVYTQCAEDIMLYHKVIYCANSVEYHDTVKSLLKNVDAAILLADEPRLVPTKSVPTNQPVPSNGTKQVQFEVAQQVWEFLAAEAKPLAVLMNSKRELDSIAVQDSRIFFTCEGNTIFFRSVHGDFSQQVDVSGRTKYDIQYLVTELLVAFFVKVFHKYADFVPFKKKEETAGLSFPTDDLLTLKSLFRKHKKAVFVACKQRNNNFVFLTKDSDQPIQGFIESDGIIACTKEINYQYPIACLAKMFENNQDASFAVFSQPTKKETKPDVPFTLTPSKQAINDAGWRLHYSCCIEGYGEILLLDSQRKKM